MALTAATKTELYRFFTIAFNAAPGVTYMNQLAEAAEVMTVKQIVEVFTAKPEFTASYPTFFTNSQFATKLVNTVVGTSAADSAKAEAVADIEAALAAGLSKGTVIFNVFSNLAALTGDAKWGGTATQLANKVAVAQYYTEDLLTDTTNLTTLRNVIANVTNTTDVSTTAAIQAVIDVAAPVSGQTFTLTTGADNFAGGTGNDTFNASYNSTNGMSFDSSDSLSGGAGNDTLNIGVGGTGTYQAASISGIETVVGNFSAAGTLSLLGATDVSAVTVQGPTANAIVNGIGSASASLKVTNTDKDVTFGFASSAVSGTADTGSVTLSAVTGGVLTIAGVETLNIASSGSANTVTTLTAANATKLVVTGDQALTVTNNLTVVTTVDASAATGAIDLDFGVGAVTVTGGSGNDVFSFEAAGAVSATGGAGNESFTFDTTATLTSADTVVGGEGTDTLSADIDNIDTTATATAYTKISGIETLTVTGLVDDATDDINTASIVAGINTVNYTTVISVANDLTLEAGTKTVGFGAINTAVLTVTDTGTATTDSLTLRNTDTSGTDNNFNGRAYATTGWETVTINTGSAATAAQTLGAVVSNVDTGGNLNFVVTGANNLTTFTSLTTDSTGAVTVNASGLTAKADGTNTFTLSNVAFSGTAGTVSIVGSAGMDTITSSNVGSTIDGGAGRDSLTGGTGADSLIGGADNDTLVGAGGNDVISGGDGVDSIDVSGAAGAVNVDGGAGNDTITIGGTLTVTDTLAGGDGTDTLSINATDIATAGGMTFADGTTLMNNLSGFEKLSVSNGLASSGTAANILDMTRFDSINYVVLNADGVAATQISGVADATTIELKSGAMTASDVLTVAYNSTTGTQSMTLKLNGAEASNEYGKMTIAGVETFNIESTSSDAANTLDNTIDLTIAAATSVTVTGAELLDLTGAAINATTITASAATGGLKVTGGSANQVITGTSAADTIDAAGGADTIDAGAGGDSIVGGSGADSITGGTGGDTITGGAGNDVITLTEASATQDTVILTYSEGGANVDTVVGFDLSTDDLIQVDLSGLNGTDGAGSIRTSSGAVVFEELNNETNVAAGAATLEMITAAATIAAGTDIVVLQGATFSDGDAVEDALEAGGAFALTVDAAAVDANDAFFVIYTDGTDAYLAAAHAVSETTDNTAIEAGNLNVINLVKLTGISSIGATTFANANFEFI
jgi:hypothetical protein